MAEDTNKKPGTENNGQNEKDWQWDAQAPEAPVDSIEVEDFMPTVESSADTVTDASAEEKKTEDGCCIICGDKLRKSPSEFYCEVCREKYMKVNYGASHIILSIVMMFVAVIGIVAFSTTSAIVKNIGEGDAHIKNQHYAKALDSYNKVESTVYDLNGSFNAFLQGISTNFATVNVYDSGTAADKKLAEIMAKTISTTYEDREAFISVVENSFTEKELNSEKYSHIKACYDFCKSMDKTANDVYEDWYALVDKRLAALDENGNLKDKNVPSHEEIMAFLDDYAAKHPEAEKSTLEYYKVMTLYYEHSTYGTVKDEDMMKYIRSAYEAAGEFGYFYADYYLIYAWECEAYDEIIKISKEFLKVNPGNEKIYYFVSKAHSAKKDWQSASKVCEDLLKYNPDSLEYYILKAEMLRRSGDYSAAVDICTKGEKAGDDAEILRQKSIAYMLNGETDKALVAASDAYEMTFAASYNGGTVSLGVLNTTALISYLVDEEKTIYTEIVGLLETENLTLEDSVTKVIKGDMTFEDLFLTGQGDVV